MTSAAAAAIVGQMVAAFDLPEDRAPLAWAAAGILVGKHAQFRATLVEVFAGRLTPAEVARAADAGLAVLAASLTAEQLEAGCRLAGASIRTGGGNA